MDTLVCTILLHAALEFLKKEIIIFVQVSRFPMGSLCLFNHHLRCALIIFVEVSPTCGFTIIIQLSSSLWLQCLYPVVAQPSYESITLLRSLWSFMLVHYPYLGFSHPSYRLCSIRPSLNTLQFIISSYRLCLELAASKVFLTFLRILAIYNL